MHTSEVSVRRYDYRFETSCEDVLSMKYVLLRCLYEDMIIGLKLHVKMYCL